MVESIIKSFEIWTDAQGVKSKGRVKSIDNINLEGISHLRELILELAVRGRLVPQNPNDEPASEFLKKIEKEKSRLVAEGKIKKQKVKSDYQNSILSYVLPSNWISLPLSQVFDVRDGTHDSPKPVQSGYPLVTSKNLSSGKLDLSDVNYISENDHKKIIERSKVDKDDILFAMIGSIGNPVIVDTDIEFSIKNVALFKYYNKDLSSPKYLQLYLRHAAIELKEKALGGVQSFVSLGILRNFEFLMPPLSEQRRIVAKVEELMALCDELETKKTATLKTHQTLVAALLQTLTAAKDAGEVEGAWRRLALHFDTLFCTDDSIDQLNQTILQLAIMGRLVKQDPADEPARELLKKIEKEKEKMVKEGKIKKEKPLPEIKDNEKLFMLPNSWEWVRLGTITNKIGSGSTPRGGANAYTTSGTIFLRSQNIRNEGLMLDDVVYIDNDTNSKMSNTIVQPSDILLNITGGSLGRSTVFPASAQNANVSQHVTIIRPTLKSSAVYLHKCILSPYIQDMIWGRQVGANREGLSKRILELFEFPLPPLREQERIVRKVEELMAICVKLQQRLLKSQEIQNSLSKTIVENAVV